MSRALDTAEHEELRLEILEMAFFSSSSVTSPLVRNRFLSDAIRRSSP